MVRAVGMTQTFLSPAQVDELVALYQKAQRWWRWASGSAFTAARRRPIWSAVRSRSADAVSNECDLGEAVELHTDRSSLMEAGRHPHQRVPCLNVKSSGVIVARRAGRHRLVGMFTPAEREQLRKELIEAAHADDDVVGAALVGSAATGREDAWSDIDLVLQVRRDTDPAEVASRWTSQFYDLRGAHHLDVIAGGVLYRVFLLASSLQIEVSFCTEDQFRATESGFRLLFGTPQPSTEPREPEASREIGMAWLYALHSRSAIARRRVWQATMMLDQLRDQLLVLACMRHGLNPHHGRDADRLPTPFPTVLRQARAVSQAEPELARSHTALVSALADEVALHDPGLAADLATPLAALAHVSV